MTIKRNVSSLIENPCRLLITFLSLQLLTFSGLAQSSPIFIQKPVETRASGVPSYVPEEYADNFILESDAWIRDIIWWGSFATPDIAKSEDDQFHIRFYEDNGGLPSENPFMSFLDETASRNTTSLFDGAGQPIFRFDALLSPFKLLAETTYYVSIEHVSRDDIYHWIESDTGLPGSYFNQNGPDGIDWEKIPADENARPVNNLSFALVPEPSVPMLLSVAFLFLLSYRRFIKI